MILFTQKITLTVETTFLNTPLQLCILIDSLKVSKLIVNCATSIHMVKHNIACMFDLIRILCPDYCLSSTSVK